VPFPRWLYGMRYGVDDLLQWNRALPMPSREDSIATLLPQFDSVRLFPGRRRNRVGVRAWAGADLGTDHIAGDDHFYTTIQFSPRS
jgi:hypothetical protein